MEAIHNTYDVTIIAGLKDSGPDLSEYDCIGFASGIDFGKFYPQMLEVQDDYNEMFIEELMGM